MYLKINDYILNSNNLNSSDKIVFSLIELLSIKLGYCWATNEDISTFTGINIRTVQRTINKLIELNYLSKYNKCFIEKHYRILTPCKDFIIEEKIDNDFKGKDKKEIIEFMENYDWLNEE